MVVPVPGAELFYSTRGTGVPCIVPCILGTKPYERLTPAAADRSLPVHLRGPARRRQSTGNPARSDLRCAGAAIWRPSATAPRSRARGRSRLLDTRCAGHRVRQTLPRERLARHRGRHSSHWRHTADGEGGDGVFRGRGIRGAEGHPERELRQASSGHSAGTGCVRPDADALLRSPFRRALRCLPRPISSLGCSSTSRSVDRRVERDGRHGVAASPDSVAHGRHDYVVPYTMWDGIIDALPDATLHLFERSGHQTFFEEPERFVEVVRAWMARTGGICATMNRELPGWRSWRDIERRCRN